MADSYPDRTNASGLWNVNEISKNKTTGGNWPGNFGTPGGRGLFACGHTPSSVDTVDFITIASTGDATDFGNLTGVHRSHGAFGDQTRCITAGGSNNSAYLNVIEFMTIANTGNGTDFGDLTAATDSGSSGVNSPTRGVIMGGIT